METGFRKKKGKLVPENHIDHMVILHNGNKIIDADIGSSVSKDPYFKFKVLLQTAPFCLHSLRKDL
jgi:sulfur-oxidizing protein SoxZ